MPQITRLLLVLIVFGAPAMGDPYDEAKPLFDAAHEDSLSAISDTANAPEHWNESLQHTEQAYELVRGSDAEVHTLALLAERAFYAGELKKAENYAALALDRVDDFEDMQLWSVGNAEHHGHLVLGMLALLNDDRESAREHLLDAGRTRGSPQLNTFGPNMALAKSMIERGERQVVLDYFELCRRFWRSGVERGTLDEWSRIVENGGIPEFKGNLVYGP